MKTIKIAGVPEHFNLPWHMCIEDGEFEAVGIDLQWRDIPEGTGKMCQMLRDGETVLFEKHDIEEAVATTSRSVLVSYFDESNGNRHIINSPATCTCSRWSARAG